MTLVITRPLIVFDLETTGVNPTRDRIVQLSLIKIQPDGTETEWETYVNPGTPIPPEATAIHGITDARVAGAPTFRQVAPVILAGFRGCDLGGYNVKRFDVPLLLCELKRIHAPLDGFLEDVNVVDANAIYHRMCRRNLAAAVEEYLGRKAREKFESEGAHNSTVDTRWTRRVIAAQVERHAEVISDNPRGIHDWSFETPEPGYVDAEGKLAYRFGRVVINFGQHSGVELERVDPRYLEWMERTGDFNKTVMRHVRAELARRRG